LKTMSTNTQYMYIVIFNININVFVYFIHNICTLSFPILKFICVRSLETGRKASL
jgi:hypothetical protein